MNVLVNLIVRLDQADRASRRLDAEIAAAVLGPPGCVVSPFDSDEGWDIDTAPDAHGFTRCWREAARVPHATLKVEDAVALIREARPQDGAVVVARAMEALPSPAGLSVASFSQRMARALVGELLHTLVAEETAPALVLAA